VLDHSFALFILILGETLLLYISQSVVDVCKLWSINRNKMNLMFLIIDMYKYIYLGFLIGFSS